MRTAISPRLAMRIFFTGTDSFYFGGVRFTPEHDVLEGPASAGPHAPSSERDVPMLLRRVLIALVFEVLESGNQLATRLSGMNHFVQEAARGGDVRIRELRAELLDFLRSRPR